MASNVFGASRDNGKVYLNVYDLHENNDMLYPIGLGLFHSGVQVGNVEYTFAGGAGIYSHEPKQVPAGVTLRESIDMGTYRGTSSDIQKIISQMRSKYSGSDYHIFNRNCNSFADDFLQQLIGTPAPGFVNRMAYYGSFFSCFLPENMNQDPTQQQQQRAVSGGSAGYSASTTSGGVYRTGGRQQAVPSKQSQPTRSFSGTAGTKLGGGDGLNTSSVGVTLGDGDSATNGLVDRRERMRQAALNRMQASSTSST